MPTSTAIRKKPWNRVNSPVYSVCSSDGDGKFNMHIMTYCTAISMKPKRFLCGIYKGTKTLENISRHPQFILQLLAQTQYGLVDLLGKKSGHSIDKIGRLEKRDLITWWNGFPVLTDALAIICVNVVSSVDAGDHIAFVCELEKYKNLNNGIPLGLDFLREKKLIRG